LMMRPTRRDVRTDYAKKEAGARERKEKDSKRKSEE
jgi:hypothetical protein